MKDQENTVQTSLQGIANKAAMQKGYRFRNLYGMLNEELLLDAWRNIRKDAANGVDGVSAAEYEQNLVEHIHNIVENLKRKRYRAKMVRRRHIPKGEGKTRPLGIPAVEDKLLQMAVKRILEAIYEQDFYRCSYGYRPNTGALEAVAKLTVKLQFGKYNYVVEADIKGFFDNIDHDWLLRMLGERIDDVAFLNLIRKWLKAGILDTDGKIIHPESGTPQGGIVSPVLANVYLHFGLDLWFEKRVKALCRGDAFILRYADDFICAFRYRDEAERFYQELPKRLNKFNLEVAPEKTEMRRFSRFHPSMKRRISFLGFETYWMRDSSGAVKVKQRTARKKLQSACRRIKEWIKDNRHLKGRSFIEALNRRLRGHYNYYNIPGNLQSIWRFYFWAVECSFKWLNRRGGKRKSFTWKPFNKAIDLLGIAKPKMQIVNREHRVFA